jgi:hypothetical protein
MPGIYYGEEIKGALDVINQMQSAAVTGRYAIGVAVAATFYLQPAATVDLHIFVELPTAKPSSLISLGPIYEYLSQQG